jgi:hypothetical protein
MWFKLEAADVDYARTSPFRLNYEAEVRATPERVFEVFTADDMKPWFADLKSMRWTSNAPHGEGSTRIVTMKMIAVKERFLVWRPGERVTFGIEACTLPLAKRMMEDFRIHPVGKASARIDYTIHYTPGLIVRALHPLVRAIFGKMFRDIVKGIVRVAEQQKPKTNGASVARSV